MEPLTIEQRDEIFKAWEDSQDHEDGGYFAEWVHDNTESNPEPNDGEICKHCAHYEMPHFICSVHNKDTGENQWCDEWKPKQNEPRKCPECGGRTPRTNTHDKQGNLRSAFVCLDCGKVEVEV